MTAVALDTPAASPTTQKRWFVRTGRIVSGLVVAMTVASAAMKLSQAPDLAHAFVDQYGYPAHLLVSIGLLELVCAVLYAVPRTAVLGAVLLAGYFGGAIATHVRIEDAGLVTPLLIAVFAWAGLYLRDERIRALLPLRRA